MSSNVIIIAGPTAVGKSAYALRLAQKNNGVIINADALQRYDALPILTAQPAGNDRAVVPHALYGTLPPDATGDVKNWMDQAAIAIQAAGANDQTPIVVGGTGLYLKSLMNGLPDMPDIPDEIRSEARDLQARIGNPAFHAELAKIDPAMADKLRPSDTQRLIRAYEVIIATGTSLAEWQQQPHIKPLPDARFHTILIDAPRDVLRDRAMKRLHQMIDLGALDEVEAFATQVERGEFPATCTPTIALGYHPFVQHLQGKITLEAAIKQAHIDTAQYIKRQQTWLRHQMTFDEMVNISSSVSAT